MPDMPENTTPDSAETVVVDDDTAGIDELTPPSANDWWKFESKEAASEWGNKMVQERLARFTKSKLEPLQQTHATLEAEIARLKPFEEATLSETEKAQAREAAKDAEIQALLEFKQSIERERLVNNVLDEVGLDPKYARFISTEGDADAIRASAAELLNVLSEDGSNTGKRTPKPKAPKADDAEAGAAQRGGSGGGSGDGESDEDIMAAIREDLAKARLNGGFRVQ